MLACLVLQTWGGPHSLLGSRQIKAGQSADRAEFKALMELQCVPYDRLQLMSNVRLAVL